MKCNMFNPPRKQLMWIFRLPNKFSQSVYNVLSFHMSLWLSLPPLLLLTQSYTG